MKKLLLDHILAAESNNLHRNTKESDVTSAGGIYRTEHPDATMWKYIDDLADKLGIHTPSSMWNHDQIELINSVADVATVHTLIGEFYDAYLIGAHLEEFDPIAQVVMFNIYTNSPFYAWKAVQQALIDMYDDKLLDIPKSELSTSDGNYGKKTSDALAIVMNLGDVHKAYFRTAAVGNMYSYYARLVAKDPKKYLVYLSGWMNRMDKLKKHY